MTTSATATATAVTPPLTGARKAAILLILLGEEHSAGILRQLGEFEVQQAAREMSRLESLTPEQTEATLEEFYQLVLGHEMAMRGGPDYTRRILNKAFGPEGAKKINDRLHAMGSIESTELDALQRADPQQLARFLHNEHPQTIALVLSHLSTPSAATLLSSLPAEIRPEVALRMAHLDEITPEIVTKIAKVIGEKLQGFAPLNRESYGGARAIADLFNHLDAGTSDEILTAIESQNPNLVETIRNMMFVFDDLLSIDAIQLKEIAARVDRKALTLALKGTSAKLKEHFFATMSARSIDMLKEDIEALGPVKIRDVEAAQQQIIATIRELETEGVISLKGGGSEQYVV
jgi:flagellar motor switch protein FliG